MSKKRLSKIRFASIIVTYRCNAKCHMCNTWKYPTKENEEIDITVYEKLPAIRTINVTGGEPFFRNDLDDIISVLKRKCNRLVISSNGFFTERIINLFKKHKDISIRISIEGLPKANDELRGITDGFDRGIRSLIELSRMGIKDIGFGITVSDRNVKDVIELYHLSKMMGVEFATAVIHNSYYFHKYDNKIKNPEIAITELEKLTCALLKSKRIKDWFRAYFNYGLINYIRGNSRLIPCEMAFDSFFLDPWGEVRPCNVMEETMGNLKEKSFDEIWNSKEAESVRNMVKNCDKNCWMIGNVAEPMKKYFYIPLKWILKNKLKTTKFIF